MKLPRYVQGFVDRHGKARYYFRRAGFKSMALPGVPWSPQFMLAYECAAAGQPALIGFARPSRLNARARDQLLSVGRISVAAEEKLSGRRRNIIERFLREADASGQCNGDKRAGLLRPEHVVRFMAARADKPEAANGLRKAIRALMKHAIKIKLRTDDPTRDVKAMKAKSKAGFHTWNETEIAAFQATHRISSKPRLALELGLCTGQARQDVVAMGEQHICNEVLSWVRGKTADTTGIELSIPVLPDLRTAIDATRSGHLTFLVTEQGKPFTPAGFGNWFRDQCDRAGLRHCTFHGLRKAASVRLAEHGCTPHEIAAITGHATLKEIERYTKAASRKRLAVSAMEKMRTPSVKPEPMFDKKRNSF